MCAQKIRKRPMVHHRQGGQAATASDSDGAHSTDYVSEIQRTVNKLEAAQAAYHKLNESLASQIEEKTAEAERKALVLREMAEELFRAEDRERYRIAGLIHDSIKQEIVGARMLLGTLRGTIDDENASTNLEMIDSALERGIQICRDLTEDLAPPILRGATLAESLRYLGERFEARHGIRVSVNSIADREPENSDVTAMLYRSVRELLTNVSKHAKVDSAEIRVSNPDDDMIEILVSDRGCGFAPKGDTDPVRQKSFGLFAIGERFEMAGGQIDIDTAPGRGTTVSLRCPLDEVSTHHAAVQGDDDASSDNEAQATAEPFQILIADDHALVVEGLTRILKRESDMRLVGTARTGAEVVAMAAELRPDVIVMDVGLPVLDGVQATEEIIETIASIPVIGLATDSAEEGCTRMLDAGALVCLPREVTAEELVSAIRDAGLAAIQD